MLVVVPIMPVSVLVTPGSVWEYDTMSFTYEAPPDSPGNGYINTRKSWTPDLPDSSTMR